MKSVGSRVWLRVFLGAAVVFTLGALAWGVSRDPAPEAPPVADPAPPIPAAASAPAAPTARAPAVPVPVGAGAGSAEAKAMTEIRTSVATSPERAIALIDAADRAHPAGAAAAERLALRVDALVKLGKIGAARDSAEKYLELHPNGPAAEHIEVLTGVHPRPPPPPTP
jgi:hypothetical protein